LARANYKIAIRRRDTTKENTLSYLVPRIKNQQRFLLSPRKNQQ
jgi:hypothetical protein